MDTNNINQIMDWEDSLSNDGNELVLLEEGDYNFVVTNFERGRFPGGQKIPACNKATITVQSSDNGLAIKFDCFFIEVLNGNYQLSLDVSVKEAWRKVTMN